jgi:transcriptional regulator with XRE-family HTH domain
MAEVVGENVRRRRDELDLLQEELAREIRLAGPSWSRTTVAKTENGTREPSAQELLALSYALQAPLSELLGGRDGLLLLRAGTEVSLPELTARIADNAPVLASVDLSVRRIADAYEEHDDAEQHAAKLLSRPVEDVRRAATALWGHRLSTEREHRLDDAARSESMDRETRRAQRGHITRRLMRELRQHFAATPTRRKR